METVEQENNSKTKKEIDRYEYLVKTMAGTIEKLREKTKNARFDYESPIEEKNVPTEVRTELCSSIYYTNNALEHLESLLEQTIEEIDL